MKIKNKKILFASLFGLVALGGTTAVIAAACNNDKNNTSSSGVQSGTYSFRSELTEAEKTKLKEDRAKWYASLSTLLDKVESVSANASEWLKNNQKLATTRDSGSLEQQDAAYAFGIAPDLASYKWKTDTSSVPAPKYLMKYYNSDKTKSWTGKGITAQDLTTNQVGTLLVHDSAFGKYSKFLKENSLGAIVSQSRSAGTASKTPNRFLPNWLFGSDVVGEESTDNNVNHALRFTNDSHAGRPSYNTNVYEGIIYTGQMLDRVYDASKFNNVHNANVDGKINFTKFEDYAKAIVAKTRSDFKKWVSSVNEWKGKKVLVESPNPQAGGITLTSNFGDQENLAKVGGVFYLQPVYFPSIYASQDDEYTPGLGAKFPFPTKNIATIQNAVDDYGWIAGKVFVDNPDVSVRNDIVQKLADGFENTTDVVIYSFNPYTIQGYDGSEAKEHLVTEFVEGLTKYVNGLSDSQWKKFKPTQPLKTKPVVGKNFFIERKDMFHDASFGYMGQQVVANTLNKWIKGKDAANPEIYLPNFTKDTVENIRAFKTDLSKKVNS